MSDEAEALDHLADNETESEEEYHRLRAEAARLRQGAPSEPKTTEEKKQAMQEWAGLVYQVGSIIEDRRGEGEDTDPVWDYLFENMDGIYERVGPIIDSVEDTVFGGPVGAA